MQNETKDEELGASVSEERGGGGGGQGESVPPTTTHSQNRNNNNGGGGGGVGKESATAQKRRSGAGASVAYGVTTTGCGATPKDRVLTPIVFAAQGAHGHASYVEREINSMKGAWRVTLLPDRTNSRSKYSHLGTFSGSSGRRMCW